MKAILRDETTGVTEVLGTILILLMTVALFSTVLYWVSTIPTPVAQTRVDMQATMEPLYNSQHIEIGVNITLVHMGGEALQPSSTVIYVTDQVGSNPPTTDVVTLHLFNGRLAVPSGLLDGSDSIWNVGEHWDYLNFVFRSADSITVTIVDTTRSVIVWAGSLTALAGSRPPIFVNVWADGDPNTTEPDPVLAYKGFVLYAQVTDPDGDLNPASVYANITAWWGSGTTCSVPLPMRDDGVFPDRFAADGVFTLGGIICTRAPYPAPTWSGTYILLNATDYAGHRTTTRFVLTVLNQGSGGGGGPGTTIPNQVWQYIGFVQIRTGEVWVSNLTDPYPTAKTFQPYRVLATWLNGGVVFHFKMSNHGNTTIFVDGWTQAFFQVTQGTGTATPLFIVAPCNVTKAAGSGGVAAYPGVAGSINDFEYAHPGVPSACSRAIQPTVFDIDPFDQQTGGTPYTALVANTGGAFGLPTKNAWAKPGVYFISILISGMAGPVNYTYAQLTGTAANPYGCTGLGTNYNPILHLNDAIPACRSTWYAQVIPFIGVVVY